MRGIAAALELGLDGDEPVPSPNRAQGLPEAATLPVGADRGLVTEAHRMSANVFLATDKQVLRRDALLAGEGFGSFRRRGCSTHCGGQAVGVNQR